MSLFWKYLHVLVHVVIFICSFAVPWKYWTKPRSKNFKNKLLSVCHWNLNSLTTHNYTKLTQLKAYISLYKYNFIYLSETYLDSKKPNTLLEIDGYNLVSEDYPDNIKRGGVGI